MRILCSIALLLASGSAVFGAELKVVSLHPLIGDLLEQVGGEEVEVVDLIGENGDPHRFEPKADDLLAADGASIYFASGMGLESYLPKLRSIVSADARIVEVGSTLPALHGACDHEGHGHDHQHEVDPHWWHSITLFQRAVGVVEEELSKAKPEAAKVFQANAAAYRQKLQELEKWTRREILKIPKDSRKLATAHEAFRYFCDAYGFESFSVQGLNREQMPDALQFAKLLKSLKEQQVTTVFPEKESNPKILKNLTRDTGMKLGDELIADGRGVGSYETMMRANVSSIVSALSED
jgi:zinc/manganese transport system substrate-binding protein